MTEKTLQALVDIASYWGPVDMYRLTKPRWDLSRGWETRIDNRIADIWDDLPVEAKLIAYIHAFRASVDDDRD